MNFHYKEGDRSEVHSAFLSLGGHGHKFRKSLDIKVAPHQGNEDTYKHLVFKIDTCSWNKLKLWFSKSLLLHSSVFRVNNYPTQTPCFVSPWFSPPCFQVNKTFQHAIFYICLGTPLKILFRLLGFGFFSFSHYKSNSVSSTEDHTRK